jgi:peptide/nickel transport system permease protein
MAHTSTKLPTIASAELPERKPRAVRQYLNMNLIVGGGIGLVLLLFIFAPGIFAPRDPYRLNVAAQFSPPSTQHWMGTDEVGRDIWTRIVHGTRYSVGMALGIVLIGASVGTVYGAVAGFAGGTADEIMMRVVDVFLSLPGFILAMAIAASVGRGILPLIVALAIVWWPSYARLARGMVLSLKERPYVEGARALGATSPYIIRRHIVPLMFDQLNVRVTQDIGYALVAVAGLSFIGLGAQPPAPEWGLLLSGARAYITSSWWYAIFPGLAIAFATVGLALLGDALSDLFLKAER